MTRLPAPTSAGTWCRHSRWESGKPWISRTGGPSPSSWTARVTPSPSMRRSIAQPSLRAQRRADLGDRAARLLRPRHPAPEAVDGAVVAAVRDVDARLAQPVGHRLALVAQDVELGGQHERGRQAREVVRAQRRGVGLEAVGAVEVEVPVALHARRGEAVALLEVAVGGRVEAGVADRVDQQPGPPPGRAGAGRRRARGCRPRCRRPPPPARPSCSSARPVGRGDAVLERGRERVLRREPVADAPHDRARLVGQRAADRVEGVDRADRPAAAVEVGHHAARRLERPVDAHGDRPGRRRAAPRRGPPRPPRRGR